MAQQRPYPITLDERRLSTLLRHLARGLGTTASGPGAARVSPTQDDPSPEYPLRPPQAPPPAPPSDRPRGTLGPSTSSSGSAWPAMLQPSTCRRGWGSSSGSDCSGSSEGRSGSVRRQDACSPPTGESRPVKPMHCEFQPTCRSTQQQVAQSHQRIEDLGEVDLDDKAYPPSPTCTWAT